MPFGSSYNLASVDYIKKSRTRKKQDQKQTHKQTNKTPLLIIKRNQELGGKYQTNKPNKENQSQNNQ